MKGFFFRGEEIFVIRDESFSKVYELNINGELGKCYDAN